MVKRIPGAAWSRSGMVESNGIVQMVVVPADKSPSYSAQMKSALEALEQKLRENGLSRSDIMSILVFISDMAGKNDMNAAWEAWVDREHPPIRACIAAGLDGEDRIELIVTAGRGD